MLEKTLTSYENISNNQGPPENLRPFEPRALKHFVKKKNCYSEGT